MRAKDLTYEEFLEAIVHCKSLNGNHVVFSTFGARIYESRQEPSDQTYQDLYDSNVPLSNDLRKIEA